MKRVRDSLWLKMTAFIVLVICMVITVFSAVIVYVNADYQWYSMNKSAVKKDMSNELLYYAGDMLIESCSILNNDADYISGADELIGEESSSLEFGYVIKEQSEGNRIIRQVNPSLAEKEGVSAKSFSHNDMIIEVYLGNIGDGSHTIPGDLYYEYSKFQVLYKYNVAALIAGVLCAILSAVSFVFLVSTVGRRNNEDSLIRNIPIEVILAIGLVLFLFIGAVNSGFYETGTDAFAVMIAVDTVLLTIIGAGFILVFAAKLRQNNLWKSSVTYLIYRFIRWIGLRLLYVLNSIHLVWKSALVVAAGIFINLFIVLNCAYNGSMLLIWFAGAVLVEAFAVYSAMALKKLKDGGKHLADGDLEYQIDKKGLFLDLSEHADNLNSIGQGMAKAVDEKMKSEMFKTELITNVSHDIKTPLTSIINYVDFLKKEKFDNKKAEEYIEVLDRQSQRLKKLTEDLVELSKAATGNVKINMEPCKIGIMMTQVMGEYQEKAEKEDLKLVMNMPENEMEILADGRSLWRVLDNLLNNICKYSQPGTRVYQTLEKQGSRAVITYKNTSKYELNMTADELMERFVRGDSSRHTEGSGLGLSIARNLVELQKGTFDIFIDGDLFKVVMEFEIKDNK